MISKKNPRNYISEWFGHRLYPEISISPEHLGNLESGECPFLTEAVKRPTQCVKSENSHGVCMITTTKQELRDWMVCPYRSLDLEFLSHIVNTIFRMKDATISLYPAGALSHNLNRIRRDLEAEKAVFLFFQDKLGGEINLSSTDKSPELSFDITFIPIQLDNEFIKFREFGIYEVQTMDFHGSYRHAVRALKNAIDLHEERFPEILADNVEWLGRKIEGPNIANVFKRTFYQLLIKFRLAGHADCSGVVLGMPRSVWNSWSPHLGNPQLSAHKDHQILQGTTLSKLNNAWLFIFDTKSTPETTYDRIVANSKVQVDVDALLNMAFSDVPEYITTSLVDQIRANIMRRLQRQYKNIAVDDRK